MIIFFKELKITKENNQMTKDMLDRYPDHKEMLDMTKSKMAKELRHLAFTY